VENHDIQINGQKIKIVGTFEDPYFCAKDLAEALGYKGVQQTINERIDKEYKITLKQLEEISESCIDHSFHWPFRGKLHAGKEGRAVYLTKNGIISLITKSKMVNAPQIARLFSESFGLNLNVLQVSKEQHTIGSIRTAFSHLESECQFAIGSYRIDLYFPVIKIAVECDERDHRDRDPIAEKEREEYIKHQLNCRFIRFNPDCKNFDIFDVINKIMMLIYES
jgi:very-short-patch-repair endonuclease